MVLVRPTQVVGDCAGDNIVVRKQREAGRIVAFSLRDGALVGGATVNSPRDMAAMRRLVAACASPHPADLEDPAFDLRRACARPDATTRNVNQC